MRESTPFVLKVGADFVAVEFVVLVVGVDKLHVRRVETRKRIDHRTPQVELIFANLEMNRRGWFRRIIDLRIIRHAVFGMKL